VAQPEKALNLAPIALQPNQARSPDQFFERASVRSDENQTHSIYPMPIRDGHVVLDLWFAKIECEGAKASSTKTSTLI
jgi:hypothetical protein